MRLQARAGPGQLLQHVLVPCIAYACPLSAHSLAVTQPFKNVRTMQVVR